MKVAVTWEMCGYVDIEADTMEEAMEKFNNESEGNNKIDTWGIVLLYNTLNSTLQFEMQVLL